MLDDSRFLKYETVEVSLKFLACCLIPRLLFAQYVGVSLGRVWSTVDWQYPTPSPGCDFCIVDAAPNASRESLAPALAFQWGATHWIGVVSEARYTQKGFATTQPTLLVNYLEAPLLLRLGKLVSSTGPISFFGEAGPAIALRVHCEVDYNGIAAPCQKGVAFGQDWRIRSYDVSGVVGIAGAVRLNDNVLVTGARIDWGTVDIGGGQGVPTKNRSTLVYVEWLWGVGAGRM